MKKLTVKKAKKNPLFFPISVYDSFISRYRIPDSRTESRLDTLPQTYGRNPQRRFAGWNSRRTHRPRFGRNTHRRRTACPPDETPPDISNDGSGVCGATASQSGNWKYFPTIRPAAGMNPTHELRKNRNERGRYTGIFSIFDKSAL